MYDASLLLEKLEQIDEALEEIEGVLPTSSPASNNADLDSLELR